MVEPRDPVRDACNAVWEGLRQIGDFSYAILPRDIAHACGDLNKAVLSQIRDCVDWQIRWTDERVAGGDSMREEWRQKCQRQQTAADATTGPVDY
jgi:hypothetical protein